MEALEALDEVEEVEDWRIGKGRETERADWRHGCVEAWMHGKSGNSKT